MNLREREVNIEMLIEDGMDYLFSHNLMRDPTTKAVGFDEGVVITLMGGEVLQDVSLDMYMVGGILVTFYVQVPGKEEEAGCRMFIPYHRVRTITAATADKLPVK